MKRILIGLVVGLLLLEAYRHLYRPPDDSAAAGMTAYKAGDFARAEERFGHAEQVTPNSPLLAHDHAAALYRLRRYEEADRGYQRSAEGGTLRTARAAYDRGNCSFSDACAEEGTADPGLLEQAVQHYEACLRMEDDTPPAGPLFDDARHNLELAKLILAEFARQEQESKPDDPPPEREGKENKPLARNDTAAQPGHDGQDRPPDARADAGQTEQQDRAADGQEKEQKDKPTDGQPKEQGDKPPDGQSKGEANQEQAPKESKECKRGGCPRCKTHPGSGAGPQQSDKKGDGPKPTPGDADNGKSPGKGKGQEDSSRPSPGATKGKPGEGGKPSPTGQNGVGDAKEPGTGPAEPGQSSKKGQPSQGKAVGPDGVAYEKQDQPQQGGPAGEGKGPAADQRPPRPGGKDGSARGAPGDGGQQSEGKQQPAPGDVDKLLRPGTSRPGDRPDGGSGGATSGQGRMGAGQAGSGQDSNVTDGSGDPMERAAARRLRQAVQRIQKSRDSRQPPPPGAGKGDAPGTDRRRDW